ncbi:MAG: xylulokinase [Ilumatobacter sp.]|nr:xylulokinase [Ilumatobacter sp.]
MGRPLIVGVDSSTQSTKVEARALDSGDVVAAASSRHPSTTPPLSEQDPNAWWAALVDAFGQLGEIRADVVAMAVAGQQHGLVLTDEDGTPLRPAKLWNDTTSAPQADAMATTVGATRWAAETGSVPLAAFTVAKLAWVIEHEPDVAARAAMVMLPHDWLTWKLTGRHVTDRGDASGTGWFSPVDDAYLPDLLDDAIGDGARWAERLPQVLAPTQPAGELTPAAANTLGLSPEVTVGAGTGDNMAAAVGLGLAPGDVAISLGTSGTVFAVSDAPTADPSGAVAGFASATGNYLPLVCTLNATKVTDTVAAWLGTDAAGLADAALEAAADPGSVTLVPYFDGERTPNLPDATGTFAGLTNSTTRAQLALAAHDGVLCGLLDGLDALRAAGARVGGTIRLIGGGARSRAYRQRCADLTGAPIIVPDTDETVATGVAVQAAVIAGADDFAAVTDRWQLGHGLAVDPRHDAAPVRARYGVTSGAWQRL